MKHQLIIFSHHPHTLEVLRINLILLNVSNWIDVIEQKTFNSPKICFPPIIKVIFLKF